MKNVRHLDDTCPRLPRERFELQQAPNGFWYVVWSERRRSKRRSLRTRNRAEAETRFERWHAPRARNTPAGPRFVPWTFRELWPLYVEQHVATKTMSAKVTRYQGNNLVRQFGHLEIAQITEVDTEEYLARRLRGIIGQPSKPATVRCELVKLRACLNWAASPKRRLIDAGDIQPFDLPPDCEPRQRWLRTEEVARLYAAAAVLRGSPRLSRVERFMSIALETGARASAIMELDWSRVDLELGQIEFNVPGRPRTSKRRTLAHVTTALRPVLERAYAERTSHLVCDSPSCLWEAIKRVADRANVPNVSAHTFRHTAASMMARRGVPLIHVADVLGNTLAITERFYRHACPATTQAAAETISGGALPIAP